MAAGARRPTTGITVADLVVSINTVTCKHQIILELHYCISERCNCMYQRWRVDILSKAEPDRKVWYLSAPLGTFAHTLRRGKGSGRRREAAVNWSPTRPYRPVVLFHHKEPQGPYLTPISLIRSVTTNKNKRQKGGCKRTKWQSRARLLQRVGLLLPFPARWLIKTQRQWRRERQEISCRKEKG